MAMHETSRAVLAHILANPGCTLELLRQAFPDQDVVCKVKNLKNLAWIRTAVVSWAAPGAKRPIGYWYVAREMKRGAGREKFGQTEKTCKSSLFYC